MLAANHNSDFDPWPLGIGLFPRRYLRFMGKSELFWTPFKQFLNAVGAFPVRRGERDTAAIETAAQLCREGHVVVMFPEGTRRKKGIRKKYQPKAHPAPRGSPSRLTCRSSRPGSLGPRLARLAQLRVAYGPPIPLDDLAGRDDAPRWRPSG